MGRYTSISIPVELALQIDELKDKTERPYRSRGEFAAHAIRRLIREVKRQSQEDA